MRIFTVFIILISFNSLYAYTIEGRLLNERYFPVPNVKISISNGGFATTDEKGIFKLATSKLPYNILISDIDNFQGVIYSGLSNLNPELILFGSIASRSTNVEFVKIFFNPIPAGSMALVKFVSDDVFYSEDITVLPGEKAKPISVEWSSSSSSITGRILYLERNQTGYTKYAEKVITVSKDFYLQNISFDSSTYYMKPQTSYITIYMPDASFERKGFFVYADFLSLHRNAELLLNATEGDIRNTRVMVPQTLSLGYRLKISGFADMKNGAGYISNTYSYPGSTFNMTAEEPPELTGPQDKYYFVNKNTLFSFERGSGTGMYVVHFHSYDPVGDLYLATDEREFISPLKDYKDFLKGVEFSWQVQKYNPYISVDDFSKVRQFANDLGYKAILTSELRTFRTVP